MFPQLVVCNCTLGWTGDLCDTDLDACEENPCFVNNTCVDLPPPSTTNLCGPCPDTMEGDGFMCNGKTQCYPQPQGCCWLADGT